MGQIFETEMILGIAVLCVVLHFLLLQVILPFHCQAEFGKDEEV